MGTNFGMTGVETFILQLCAAQKASGARPALTLELVNRAELQRMAEANGIPVYDFLPRSAFEDRVPRSDPLRAPNRRLIPSPPQSTNASADTYRASSQRLATMFDPGMSISRVGRCRMATSYW
jgi:hypothetical protein